eukprot:scaffold456_cov171-Amphora_coffeaeformis.AAC.5
MVLSRFGFMGGPFNHELNGIVASGAQFQESILPQLLGYSKVMNGSGNVPKGLTIQKKGVAFVIDGKGAIATLLVAVEAIRAGERKMREKEQNQ